MAANLPELAKSKGTQTVIRLFDKVKGELDRHWNAYRLKNLALFLAIPLLATTEVLTSVSTQIPELLALVLKLRPKKTDYPFSSA